jgi:hypothetical protein
LTVEWISQSREDIISTFQPKKTHPSCKDRKKGQKLTLRGKTERKAKKHPSCKDRKKDQKLTLQVKTERKAKNSPFK